MEMKDKKRLRRMEVQSKMLPTVSAIAGNSRLGMTVGEALKLTEKTLKHRRAKQRQQKASRRRNRK